MVSRTDYRCQPSSIKLIRAAAFALLGSILVCDMPVHAEEPLASVGSSTCGECHAAVTALYLKSHHALAMQKATEATLLQVRTL
jgi:hypothetical protein